MELKCFQNIAALLILLSHCAGWVTFAGEFQRPVLIEQDGEKVPFYVLAGTPYRITEASQLKRAKQGVPLAVEVKCREVQGKALSVYGEDFVGIRFQLLDGVNRDGVRPGSNLILGFVLKGESTEAALANVQVHRLLLLPDDLAILKVREEELLRKKHQRPEDFYRLGDWLDRMRRLSQIIDESVYQQYEENRDRLYETGIQRDLKSIQPTPKEMLYRLTRLMDICFELEEKTLAPGMLSEAFAGYQDLLKAIPAATQAAENGRPPNAANARRLAALSVWQLAELKKQIKDGSGLDATFVVRAAGMDPAWPRLKGPMTDLGYQLYGGKWVTANQAERMRQEAQSEKAVVEKVEPAPDEKEEGALSKGLLLGKDFEESRTSVYMLIGMRDGGGLKELGELLGDLPEDVARKALFMVAAWHDRKRAVPLLEKMFQSSRASVRQDAIDLLCQLRGGAGVGAMLDLMAKDEELKFSLYAVDSLWALPGKDGVTAMVAILERTGLDESLRKRALFHMQQETGKKDGLDPFPWKRWWAKNQGGYNRKLMAQEPITKN